MSLSLRKVALWVTDRELWPVALVAVASVARERLLLPALVVALLFWPLRWLAHRRFSVRTTGDWAVCLLLLMAAVSLWVTPLADVTRPLVLQLLTGVALYYAVVNWTNDWRRLRWLVVGLSVVALGLALLAPFGAQPIGQGFTFLPKTLAILPSRLAGTINPNVMAGTLVVLMPLALARLLFGGKRQWSETVLLACVTGLTPAVLLLMRSRGALLSLAAAVLVVVMLRWRWGWLAPALAVMTGMAIVWRVGLDRIATLFSSGSSIAGLSDRLEVWSRALYMIQDFPLTGVGMGLFSRVAALLYPFFTIGPDVQVPHAHNIFLQVAVDLGLPGLMAWLALLLLVYAVAWQTYRRGRSGDRAMTPSPLDPRPPNPYLAGLGAGLLASQVALIVHGLTDAVTWGTRPAVLVWAVWGAAMAAHHLRTLPADLDVSDAEAADLSASAGREGVAVR